MTWMEGMWYRLFIMVYGTAGTEDRESCGLAVSNTKGEAGNIQFHKDLGW